MQNQDRYSSVSTINHWISAIIIVAMLTLGYAIAAAPTEKIEDYILSIHVSLGFFVFLFIAWRIAFRLYEGFPENIGKRAWQRKTAYFVHRAILILLALQVVTGPMYLFTENECMNVFGWFSVCVPLERFSVIHELMEWLHKSTGMYFLPALLVVHFVGAIHHYVNKDKQETPADL